MKKFICLLLCFMFVLPCVIAQASHGLGVPKRSPAEIKAFCGSHPTGFSGGIYEKKPVVKAPYSPGKLSADVVLSALNALNRVRFTAGVGSNVTENQEYAEMAQAAALVNAANGSMSHYPVRPAGMKKSLYELGYSGASTSNLAWGYSSLTHALISGWMHDGDASNISRVGHRRWALDPSLSETGFGWVNSQMAMSCYSAFGFPTEEDMPPYVAWPAQAMPVEWMSSGLPWSISYTYSEPADESAIRIKIVRKSDKKTWKLSSGSKQGYLHVDRGGYGQGSALIFRPSNISYKAGDHFDITVTGAEDDPLKYSVDIFSLNSNGSVSEATVGNLKYKLDNKAKTATVLKPVKAARTVTIPNTIKANGSSYKVVAVAASAFSGDTKLKTLKIGNNVKTIGDNAFRNCSAMASATLGKKVRSIGAGAFSGCGKLKKIRLLAVSLKTVGKNAFTNGSKKVTVLCSGAKIKKYRKLLKAAGLSKKAVWESSDPPEEPEDPAPEPEAEVSSVPVPAA